ncbi:uracil-regulated protein 1 [Ramicandelaber brevisporus]|nr:uracil-regulated protein 1 [Ramicandelaber brevisporus]
MSPTIEQTVPVEASTSNGTTPSSTMKTTATLSDIDHVVVRNATNDGAAAAAADLAKTAVNASNGKNGTASSDKRSKKIDINWGASTASERGAVVAGVRASDMHLRNAIGAYSGPYSVYRALAVASGDLPSDHHPNYQYTDPPVNIGPYPQWSSSPDNIVTMDPYGHIVQRVFASEIEAGYEVRPTIAITKAHMIIPELVELVRDGRMPVDGKIILNDSGEITVTKAAIEPVWYLPGIAKRLGITEERLRHSLYEEMGGAYPDLVERPDIKVFLPPIGGITVYIFGDPADLADPSKHLSLRIHDECNGSDVFGSDICTCRPYLVYGIREAIRSATMTTGNGGVGLVVYLRKEGRCLGEVTKYMVYNARKRHGDTAAGYFQRTIDIAGVKDMRYQALMPDVLQWLGIKKIDRMMSMSNMKHDAIVEGAGIPILERVEIPDDMLPPDSKVEMEAKVADGYFTTKAKVPTAEELEAVAGRTYNELN